MNDGIYFDVFVIKDGIRYNVRTLPVTQVSNILTNAMLDGLGNIINIDENKEEQSK